MSLKRDSVTLSYRDFSAWKSLKVIHSENECRKRFFSTSSFYITTILYIFWQACWLQCIWKRIYYQFYCYFTSFSCKSFLTCDNVFLCFNLSEFTNLWVFLVWQNFSFSRSAFKSQSATFSFYLLLCDRWFTC